MLPKRPLNGVNILFLLRNKIAKDWATLCRGFGLDPKKPEHETLLPDLREKLEDLRQLGLIEFDVDPNAPEKILGEIRTSEHWTDIHRALGGQRLVDLAALNSAALVVKPYFRRPERPAKVPDLFVLMPFRNDLKPVYDDHITKVARNLGLTVARADDFFAAHEIMSDIWAAICAARAVVADCTEQNANVFYEIGLAHAVGKPVVLITQNVDDVPFDLRPIRFIQYEYTPRGMLEFEQSLAETLKETLGLEVKKGS